MGFLLAAVLVIAALLLFCSLLLNMGVRPRRYGYPEAEAHEAEHNGVPLGEFSRARAKGEAFSLKTADSLTLRGLWLTPPGGDKNRAVVLSHGHGCNMVFLYKYARLFLRLGYCALLFDYRSSGESEGRYVTLGYREKDDLRLMVDEAFRRLPGGRIGVMGESMGAATAVLEACRDPRLSFMIADCAYAELSRQMEDGMRHKLGFALPVFTPLTSLLCKLRAGFRFEEVSPQRELARAKVLPPLLFIHGTADKYVPPAASRRLFDAANTPHKRLILFEGAGHARSYGSDPEKYEKGIREFLDGIQD